MHSWQINGIKKQSFLADLLDDYERKGIVDVQHEEDMKVLSATLYEGMSEGLFI